ncbi:MAG TPA: ribonuclease E inhibitor RraB [Acidimicrobiia bacterium]|jgi:hypothetical protein|nr:ribonuclease E inhibitor RraB [Acidimicrobiia bacterium]
MSLFHHKRHDEPVHPNDRSPRTGLKYKDLAVLGSLMEAGADLAEPRHVLHYLYFKSREAADAAAAEGRHRGFDAAVRAPLPEDPDHWRLVAQRHDVVIDVATVRNHGDFFDGLAEHHAGEYDGWEASV